MTDDAPWLDEFAGLYDRCFAKVYNYVRYRVGDPAAADDVTSRVFEKALGGFARFDPRLAPAEAWLFAIARNAVNDHFRAKRWLSWLPFDVLGERPGRDPAADDYLLENEARQGILRRLEGLSERERELIALKFGARMTNRAIAAQVGLKESHVAVILFRALRKLRSKMRESA